jgi:hypothetical protein
MPSLISYLFGLPTHENIQGRERNNFLDGIASLPYHQRMTHFLRSSTRHWVAGGVTVVDFRPLYTANIHNLQRQLAKEIEKLETEDITDNRLEAIQETLHQYSRLSFTVRMYCF